MKVVYCLVAYVLLVAFTLAFLIATRTRKKLSTESSPERKLLNKIVGLFMCITQYLIFVPIITFNANFFKCPERTGCLIGNNLIVFIFAVVGIGIKLFLTVYSSSMLTTCYPHENIPWAHFPSNIPFLKLAIRIPIVLAY
jgi:hypothetical protein